MAIDYHNFTKQLLSVHIPDSSDCPQTLKTESWINICQQEVSYPQEIGNSSLKNTRSDSRQWKKNILQFRKDLKKSNPLAGIHRCHVAGGGAWVLYKYRVISEWRDMFCSASSLVSVFTPGPALATPPQSWHAPLTPGAARIRYRESNIQISQSHPHNYLSQSAPE